MDSQKRYEDIIPENTLVEVVAIEGVKAIVKIKK